MIVTIVENGEYRYKTFPTVKEAMASLIEAASTYDCGGNAQKSAALMYDMLKSIMETGRWYASPTIYIMVQKKTARNSD